MKAFEEKAPNPSLSCVPKGGCDGIAPSGKLHRDSPVTEKKYQALLNAFTGGEEGPVLYKSAVIPNLGGTTDCSRIVRPKLIILSA